MAGGPNFPSTSAMLDYSEAFSLAAIHAGIAVGAALLLHLVTFAVLGRMARASDSETDDLVITRLGQPLRWAMAAVALSLASEGDALLARGWGMVGRFIEPALFGWVAFALVKAFAAAMERHTRTYEDELAARSRRTRIAIFSRTAGFGIVFVTVALVLFGIPAVRNIGVTLMASAGVATLAVGAAAQPALKSLIAGIQIALTEPIRIGDFVVVDGESGRVEDIRLSYVVIRTADERRLIVPTSKFLDASFQNWTRLGGGITGSVVLPIKPGHPVQVIREAYEALLTAHPDWDKRTGALQVSEVQVGSIELKLVMSAAGPTALSRLRPAMREAMIEWLRENMPQALCDEV
ncbi:mechanosensitive ion channel domain-containing protein [Novosphingobium sp.]|jgi:small-conductance mechanosensitive channel|uniref:mechanosensitive ion channel family protein n=1 Tax=Novosphingobium sp. TaxID=1874826 RepID=UPI001ED47D48|nr:mechanosensitive ion channel domain-containing protein [Novosphingobium sp.]MBK6800103.1 mechanosensitive ion channel [Novosphingobium sp.]MBK9010882.1 mechanosensitive ion channel [Novosphingobium sp.]